MLVTIIVFTQEPVVGTVFEAKLKMSLFYYILSIMSSWILWVTFNREIMKFGMMRYRIISLSLFIILPIILMLFFRSSDNIVVKFIYKYSPVVMFCLAFEISKRTGFGLIGRIQDLGRGWKNTISLAYITFALLIFIPIYMEFRFYNFYLLPELSISEIYILEILSGATIGTLLGVTRTLYYVLINR